MTQEYRRSQGRDRGDNEDLPAIPQADLKKIVENGDPETLVRWAQDIGRNLKRLDATRSQVRNIFGTVRQIQMRWQKAEEQEAFQAYRDAVLLKPKLSYYAHKEKGSKARGMQYLERVLTPALELITGNEAERQQRFNRFADFFEAIVAYHHAAGAKD